MATFVRLHPYPGADGPLEPPVGEPGEAAQRRSKGGVSGDDPGDAGGGKRGERGGEGEVEGEGQGRAQERPLEAVGRDGFAEGPDREGRERRGLALGRVAGEGPGAGAGVVGRERRRQGGFLFFFFFEGRRLRARLERRRRPIVGWERSDTSPGMSCF